MTRDARFIINDYLNSRTRYISIRMNNLSISLEIKLLLSTALCFAVAVLFLSFSLILFPYSVSLSICFTFRNIVVFEVTRRDISRTRASGGAAGRAMAFRPFSANLLSGARQIDLEMERLSSI